VSESRPERATKPPRRRHAGQTLAGKAVAAARRTRRPAVGGCWHGRAAGVPLLRQRPAAEVGGGEQADVRWLPGKL